MKDSAFVVTKRAEGSGVVEGNGVGRYGVCSCRQSMILRAHTWLVWAMLTFPLLASGCLDRPIGAQQPKTTSIIVDSLRQGGVDKIDLLFMIDNSLSMGDKQKLLVQALPDLVTRLVDPVCVAEDGSAETAVAGQCSPGFKREFRPIDDIHIGVITSSLGGFGAELDCTSGERGATDNAHLLGSLDRVRARSSTTPSFLGWCRPGSDQEVRGECVATPETNGGDVGKFTEVFTDQVDAAGETGCGWEASLEAWYRFLIDPAPWTEIVRQDCPSQPDGSNLCAGPKIDPNTGAPEVDRLILEQRAAFMRADSLLAIVMLTDENDCSFKATGQSWRLAQTVRKTSSGRPEETLAYKGAAICQSDGNSPCCVSCGAPIPDGCPSVLNDDGETISAGCEEPTYPKQLNIDDPPTEDPVNLRCFDQKRRFGVDYLYPVKRYSTALASKTLCPYADDLDPLAQTADGTPLCGPGGEYTVENPLYVDWTYEQRLASDPMTEHVVARPADLVFLAGIVGVPWQDLAVDRNAQTLSYRSSDPNSENPIDWVPLLGSAAVGAPYDLRLSPPTNPLMHEQIEPREGTDPAVNGGEWNILGRDDLQYACSFPLNEAVDCPETADDGETVPCDCTYYGDEAYQNPLCDGLRQTRAKAYPGIRPLQVLRDYGANSIVASICPKNTTDANSPDYGYRPAMAAIVDRLKAELVEKCLERPLEIKQVAGGMQASCIIVEAEDDARQTSCEASRAREDVPPEIAKEIRNRLLAKKLCTELDGDCLDYHLCGIEPLAPGSAEYESCLSEETPSGNGWCYVDPENGLGEANLVETCAPTERRKVRFAGASTPKKGTVTFFACAGAPQSASLSDESAQLSE
jgi:hypothetical protein